MLLERSWTSIFHYFGVTVPAFLCSSTLQGTAFITSPPKLGGVKLHFWVLFGLCTLWLALPSPPNWGGGILHFLLLSLHVFLGRVHGGAQIVPEKNRESFPLSENVFWCWLRMLLLAEYWGCSNSPRKNRESFLLSKNVCWCWLRMLLLAEYVPATMLHPKALGTAFQKTKGPNGIAHPHLH